MKKAPITIVTGRSGAGKRTALAAFEDSGYYCVDNMPVALLPRFLELSMEETTAHCGVVFGMDTRENGFIRNHGPVFDQLKRSGIRFRIVYLEADEKTLVRRFSQTRRKHPIADGINIQEAIREEMVQLKTLRQLADQVIDTSSLNVHELKTVISKLAGEHASARRMHVQIVSFGFKYGLPLHADLVMDVRFLINPYFDDILRPLSGEDQKIRDYVLNNDRTCLFLQRYIELLDLLIPQYEDEGKAYLTIAIGCTGGRHRSVVIAEKVFGHVTASGRQADLTHRDIEHNPTV